MQNVCYQCGLYRVDKRVEGVGKEGVAICPECGFRHPFVRQPLLIVGGASGTGKSTALRLMMGQERPFVPLEMDILNMEGFPPGGQWHLFHEAWLRLAKNIGQAGKPVLLFGSGAGVPSNIEPCVERRYFTAVHYLALICDEDELARRLRARPTWRKSGSEQFIEEMLNFNRWFKTDGQDLDTPITLIDTTAVSVANTVTAIERWVQSILHIDENSNS